MPKRNPEYMTERRNEILDATMACLRRDGITGLSTTQICEEAGISMGALYTHFDTKDDILRALVARSAKRRQSGLNLDSMAALRKYYLKVIDQEAMRNNRQANRADLELLTTAVNDEALSRILEPLRDASPLLNTLRNLRTKGEIRQDVDPETAATAIEALVQGCLLLALVGGRPVTAYRSALLLLLDSLT